MKAIILATGEQPALAPLTNRISSPLLTVANRPVIVHAVETLIQAGIKDITISLRHGAAAIEEALGAGERWNMRFHYALQRHAWGAAGTLKRSQGVLTDTFLVLPGDALFDFDIKAALRLHQQQGATATAILSNAHSECAAHAPWQKIAAPHLHGRSGTFEPYGDPARSTARPLSLAPPNRRPHLGGPGQTQPALRFTGAYIFEAAVLELIPADTPFEIQPDLLAALAAADQQLVGYALGGYWNPLSSFSAYLAAQSVYLKSINHASPRPAGMGTPQTVSQETTREIVQPASQSEPQPDRMRHAYVNALQVAEQIWIEPGSSVDAGVRLTPPVYIGAGCRIARNVALGPDVVLGDRVIIDEDAVVQRSTVLDNTYIGKLISLDKRVVSHTLLIDATTGVNLELADPIFLDYADPLWVGRMLRSLVDRVLALLLLGLLAPLMLIVSFVIGVTSSESVFLRLSRAGVPPSKRALVGPVQPRSYFLRRWRTRRADGRTVALGAWLERWEMARLPELINVVRGEIALVGVQPLSSAQARAADAAWPQRRDRHPDGFTGLWYTSLDAAATLDDACIADLYQLALHGWIDDWRQLWQTPGAWWRRSRGKPAEQPAATGGVLRQEAARRKAERKELPQVYYMTGGPTHMADIDPRE